MFVVNSVDIDGLVFLHILFTTTLLVRKKQSDGVDGIAGMTRICGGFDNELCGDDVVISGAE